MRQTTKVCAWGLAATAAMALTACGKDAGDRQPGPAEIALVTQQLDSELNDPVQRLHKSLVRATSDKRIYPEELEVSGEGDPTPVDWWAYDQGLIRLAGVADYRGYFGLTPKGEAFEQAPAPAWLAARLQGPMQLNCSSGSAYTTCKASGIATVLPTKDGAAFLQGRTLPQQAFTADLDYGASGWTVSELHATSGAEPAEAMRTAIFGDRDSVAKARYRFAIQMNKRV